MSVLMIAICFSKVFSTEHSQRTDQLILSSRFGRKKLYYAKIVSGITSSLILGMAVFGSAAAVIFWCWGFDGGGTAIQMLIPFYSGSLSAKEAVLICIWVLLTGMVLCAVFTMVLSEKYKSGVGAMAVVVGILFLWAFLNIPQQYRGLAQLWDMMLPTNMCSVWNIFSVRLVPFMGNYCTMWQIVPFIWLFLAVGLILYGKRVYGKIM